MKTFKLSKRVQIILATLLVLVVGIVVAGIWTNDKAMAVSVGQDCTNCPENTIKGTLEWYFLPQYHALKCNKCGDVTNMEKHTHAENQEPIEYVDNGDGTHCAVYNCSVCQAQFEDIDNPEEHTPEDEGRVRDATYHYYVCKYCKVITDTVKHEMTSPTYFDNQFHYSSCRNCSWTEKNAHTAEICEVCMKTNYEGCECDSGTKYLINYSATQHMVTCTAGCPGVLEAHTFTNGVCACGAKQYIEEKNTVGTCSECDLTGLKEYAAKDSKYHIMTCTCGESKLELHTYTSGICKYCGYTASADDITILGKASPCCEGGFYQLHKQTATTHTWACSECGDILSTEQHKTNANGVCEECGYQTSTDDEGKDDGEVCEGEHTYETVYAQNSEYLGQYHILKKVCSKCEAEEIIDETDPCSDSNDDDKCDKCGATYSGNDNEGNSGSGSTGGGNTGGTTGGGTSGDNSGDNTGDNTGDEGTGDTGTGDSGDAGDTTCKHTYTMKNDNSQHWEECTKCEVQKENTLENHTFTYKDNEDGTHSATCSKCSYKTRQEHKYNNGKCNNCNAIKPEETCSHSYTMKNDNNQHWKECTKCGIVKEGTLEDHTFEYVDNEDETHSATCTTCNYNTREEHDYKNGECDNCNATEPKETCTHSYTMKEDSKQHWEECTKCGMVKKGTLENHTIAYKDNGNGTHTATCSICSYKLTENHTYKNGKCEDCNVAEPEKECSHSYTMNKNSNQHWQECTKCGIKGTLENHTFIYKDNGNGTHTATCSTCSYKLTENHTYKNGKCEDCNVTEPKKECSHTYTMKKDNNQHWKECTKCGIKGTLENHTFTYKDNGNGKHTATCSTCSYELTEDHKYGNEKCNNCNAIKPSEDNNNNNNNGNNSNDNNNDNYNNDDNNNLNNNNNNNNNGNNSQTGDNTTAGDSYSKAGSESILLIAAVILGIILIISMSKIKKYKNI